MEIIEEFDKLVGRIIDLDSSWSDKSSIEKYNATGDTYPYLQVYAASSQRIFLKGAPKPAGSVRTRVQLLKMLLFTGRFKVSANCKHAIKMLEELKKGKEDFVVEDENKHIFDAITYALLMEMAEELERGGQNKTAQKSNGIATQV
jgi:hypothetical protein